MRVRGTGISDLMPNFKPVRVTETILAVPRFGPRNSAILAMCVCLAMLDGFDNQAIGFVAPAVAKAWALSPARLGPIFSAGLFGALFGGLIFGPMGDRGNRAVVLGLSVLVLAGGTFATAWAADFWTLLALRIGTGLGLGGTIPNLMALAAEQAPPQRRATAVSIVIVGIPMGAGLGGIVAASLISDSGWQSVFLLGGVAPLPVLAVLWITLGKQLRGDRVQGAANDHVNTFVTLIEPQYRIGSLLLWTGTFFAVMLTYTISSWLPTLLTAQGISTREAVIATSLLNLGAVVGGIALGRIIDKTDAYRSLATAYFIGGLAIGSIAWMRGVIPVTGTIFVVGIFVLGGNTGFGALAGTFYERSLRGTGIGVTLSIGRLGAVVGPLLISLLLLHNFGVSHLFIFASGVAMTIVVVLLLMNRFLSIPDPTGRFD